MRQNSKKQERGGTGRTTAKKMQKVVDILGNERRGTAMAEQQKKERDRSRTDNSKKIQSGRHTGETANERRNSK